MKLYVLARRLQIFGYMRGSCLLYLRAALLTQTFRAAATTKQSWRNERFLDDVNMISFVAEFFVQTISQVLGRF